MVVGETRTTFICFNIDFTFEGLVMEDLDVEVPGETLFMEANDVAVRLAKREVLLSNGSPTHTCPRPHPVPSQLFTEPLYSALLLLPRLFSLESS